jgi:hypothetical protein
MKTRDDVVKAVRHLSVQLERNPQSWENPTLDRYLEAMASWREDSGKRDDQPTSWGLIIQMVQAAKIYQ